jgi:hypothetical protein
MTVWSQSSDERSLLQTPLATTSYEYLTKPWLVHLDLADAWLSRHRLDDRSALAQCTSRSSSFGLLRKVHISPPLIPQLVTDRPYLDQ